MSVGAASKQTRHIFGDQHLSLLDFHEATKHSLRSVQSDRHQLDWSNQPLPFKIYTSLAPHPLTLTFDQSGQGSLNQDMLARLCYFSNGVTKLLRGMPFRAAACTGALYHVELYLACGDLEDLEAGVYHYGAHDNALRQLRTGDFRQVLVHASADEASLAQAQVVIALTSTWWRNAWKYQARAYRHAFWDSGTILANLLGVARGQGVAARVVVGFVDHEVNALLDVNSTDEATICLVSLGSGGLVPPDTPEVRALNLATRALSAHQVPSPAIVEAHTESSLEAPEAVAAWRARFPPAPLPPSPTESIESVILRRGSSRRFTHDPISSEAFLKMVEAATSPTPSDVAIRCDLYVIVNSVHGLRSGTYVLDRSNGELELLRPGEFRREAAYLDLGQDLAGDAAFNAYWLVNLDDLGNRGYRAAQLAAAIEGGKLYLAAYAFGFGATGLTFFDDDVTDFFSPHAAGKSVMFLMAVGHPARRSSA